MFGKKIAAGIILVVLLSCTTHRQEQAAKRYVVTSPEVAEIVTLLDGISHIVGITAECNYPASLQNKTIVGNFGQVSFEKIIELNPDIVFTAGLEQNTLASELHKLDIHTEKIYAQSISELLHSIENIGNIIGQTKRAEFVIDSLQTALKSLPQFDVHPDVYVEIYGDPIMSVSDSSFVGQLVELAGGNNLFDSLIREYCRVNAEDVITKNPEIILITYPGMKANDVADRKGWEVISAVKNKRIYTVEDVDPDLILRASPRFISGIKALQKVFYEE